MVESIPLDRMSAEIPFEERSILDPAVLGLFGAPRGAAIRPLVADPLVDEFWPLVAGRAAATTNLGECLSQARHIQEGQWGTTSLELPQSRICSLPSFYRFTAHLLANSPRFGRVYNEAAAEYRRANHVRSLAHPVPDLVAEDDWREAPFWIWDHENPRRRRLFVRRQSGELVLSDRQALRIRLALAGDDPAQLAEQLAELQQSGIKIRTRAS